MKEELIEHGIVLKSENGYAEVQLVENDSCEECTAKIFCKPHEDNSKKLTIKDITGLTAGDKVTIVIPGRTILKASFNLYLYPLIILVLTLLLGTHYFDQQPNSEIYSFIIAVIAIVIYYSAFFLLSKKQKEQEPQIIVSKF